MSLFFMSARHSDSTPLVPILSYSLPNSLLGCPTEGNSYSLVIMWRMMCALKCALPDWLPLRRPAGATEEGHWGADQGCWEDRVMRGDRCEAGTMDHDCNYKGEIWPDKQYCALRADISSGISVAVMLNEGDSRWEKKERETEGEVLENAIWDEELWHLPSYIDTIQKNDNAQLQCADWWSTMQGV